MKDCAAMNPASGCGVHRDRRKTGCRNAESVSAVLLGLLLVCFSVVAEDATTVTPPPTPGADGCRLLSSGDGSALDELQCHVRSLSAVVLGEWLANVTSVSERQSVRVLSVECSDASAFPSSLGASSFASLPQLDTLLVDSCRLGELASGTFSGAERLRHVRLQTRNSDWPGTQLQLALDVLDDVRHLETLDLAFNDIRVLPSASLCSLASLHTLNLTANRLTELGWAAPSVCLAGLRVLDVSHNQLAHLPARMLASLTSLQELHVQGNNLLDVDDGSLYGLTQLRLLNVAGNRLTSLPPALLASSRQLSELYAGANGLSVLAPGLLANLTQLLVLDLSDNELTSSSLLPPALTGLRRLAVLSLHNNRIGRLDASLLTDATNLQILRLDGNVLDALPDGLLSAQRHLHTLIASRNRLTHVSSTLLSRQASLAILALDNNAIERVDADAFAAAAQSLRDVNLSGNNLASVPAALAPLTQLQSLDLGENRIVGLDASVLSGMKELSSLRLLDNAVGNISRSLLSQLPGLRILNLSKNQIGHVEEGAFSRNRLLQAVRLDANQLTSIGGLFHALPQLAWLNVSDNRLTHFDYALIPPLLQWLDVHANRIAELGNYFQLDDQLALQTLDASFNRLTELTAAMLPDSLQVVSLNDNLIRTVQPYAFFRKQNLSRVDLYANHIRQLDQNALRISQPPEPNRPLPEFYIGGNPFDCDCNMEWIQRINTPDHLRQHPRVMDLEGVYCRLPHSRPQRSYVPLVEASPSHFVCTYETHCFALCHCCDFDACDCEMTCPNNCTCYHDQSWSVNVVDCSAGGGSSDAPHTELPERIPMDVTELYLDGNSLRQLASHKFIGRKNLRALYLNASGVEVIRNRTFNGLRGLRTLHLQDNRIRALDGFEFGDLESLRELYLHNNVIASVANRTFSSLRNLEVLRLDGNRLVDLAVWTLIPSSPYLVQLSLAGNQWSCDCAFLAQFRAALADAGPKVADAADLVCVSNDIPQLATGSNTLPILVATAAEALEASPSAPASAASPGGCTRPTPSATTIVQQRLMYDYLPLLVATLVAFACVCLLVLLAFVYRTPIRIWCHARYGLRLGVGRQAAASQALDAAKLFDAFVSYSAKDDAFVQQMLATNLEYGSPSYKLCLQHRDVPSGAHVSESVGRAVESSRRTVMVISHNFIKSEWCRFEYKSALHQLLKNRRKCLIVILIGDIRRRDLDPDLRLYLKTGTYLHWGQVAFWDRLRYALPDVTPPQRAAKHAAHYHHHHHIQHHQTHPQPHPLQQQQQQQVQPLQQLRAVVPIPVGRPQPPPHPQQQHPHPPCSVAVPARSVTLNMSA